MITQYQGEININLLILMKLLLMVLFLIFKNYEDKGIPQKHKDFDDIIDKGNLLGEISSDDDDEEIKDDVKKNVQKKQFEENYNLLGEASYSEELNKTNKKTS